MVVPRVHSHLPPDLAAALSQSLSVGGVEHVDSGSANPVAAAQEAAADARAVAFVGPFRSFHVGETAAILNEAGMAQLAPAATYAALTRDEPGAEDGMPASLVPTGRRTLFRLVARDTAVCQAVVAHVGTRCALVSDGGSYGEQVAAQIRLAGVEPDDDADTVLYAGLARDAPLEPLRATAPRPVVTLDGALEPEFAAALGHDRLQVASAAYPREGSDARTVHAFIPQTAEAGMLVVGSLIAAGPDRSRIVEALRGCGRFDEFGDTTERRVGLWRIARDGAIESVRTLEIPARGQPRR